MAGQGVQHLPIRFPREAPPWFVDWMGWFIRDVLANIDPRNGIEGTGISITGQPSEPATFSTSEDLQALFDADLILAEAAALLPNSRTLEGVGGISVTDGGAGGQVSVGIDSVDFNKLPVIPALSVIGNRTSDEGTPRTIVSSANDTVLRRVADALEFGELTAAMAADGLWAYAKLDAGVQASLDLADSSLQPGGIIQLPTYSAAALPDAAANVRGMIYVSDETGGAVPAFSDGTDWRRVTDRAVVS
jgi:hypothetical protein